MSKSLTKTFSWLDGNERALIFLGLVLAILMLFRVNFLHLTKALTDQNAHLNFARLAFDSMTPGINQIGFWPPLLHLLMAPFTLIPAFYDTGLAAVIVLVPVLLMGTIFLYRTILALTQNKYLALTGGIIFLVNPYVLYYSTTPMMEILFLANLFGVAYFLVKWLETQKLQYLLLTGLFVSLASLSRYEGLILIPVVSGLVLMDLWNRRRSGSQIQALLILFLGLALLSVGYVIAYGLIFAGNPLAFTGGSWIKTTGTSFLTKHNFVQSIIYILHASFYMLGKPVVWIALGSVPLVLLFARKRFQTFATLAVLGSPVLFILLALFSGSYSIAVPELPPYNFFNNDRYGLTWIGFAIMAPLLLWQVLAWYVSRRQARVAIWISAASLIAAVAAVPRLYNVAFVENFQTIKADINIPSASQLAVSDYFSNHYDYGKILITRADNDPILAQAEIPLKQYIFEGNYLYFNQSLQQPWIFTRYVVMHNPKDNDQWSATNDAIAKKWGSTDEFTNYYDLVLETPTRNVYKVNDVKILQLARAQNLDATAIPSINAQISWWDPGNVYSKLRAQEPSAPRAEENPGISLINVAQAAENKTTKQIVQDQMGKLYQTSVRPYLSNGFMNAPDNRTSEAQSYGMFQATLANDRKTFDRIWQFTKSKLQRSDKLISWQYNYSFFLNSSRSSAGILTKKDSK